MRTVLRFLLVGWIGLVACWGYSAELGRDWLVMPRPEFWTGAHGNRSVAFNGKMWVLDSGDSEYNSPQVWYSTDGGRWKRVAQAPPWFGRWGPKVVVHNQRMWILGGRTMYGSTEYLNDVWYSADGVAWARATGHAQWPGREDHAAVVYDGKIWVLGGYSTNTPYWKNDVWYSSDGVTWTQATSNAPWPARSRHASTVFGGKIWVLGGYYAQNSQYYYNNDVWYSSDGVNWTQATAHAPWSPRSGHAAAVYNGRIWIAGGGGPGSTKYNDVWYSSDGIRWTQATPRARWFPGGGYGLVVYSSRLWLLGADPWSSPDFPCWYTSNGVAWTNVPGPRSWQARYAPQLLIYSGKIWILGGLGDFLPADVWYSANGTSWTLATVPVPWGTRGGRSAVVHNGKMWVMGGDSPPKNDVWYSVNGKDWTTATAHAQWSPRAGHTSVVFGGKMWVIGGRDARNYPLGDVWYSSDGANWTTATSSLGTTVAGHASVVYNGRMWVIYENAVWSSADGRTWTRATNNAPWGWGREGFAAAVCDGKMWVMGGGSLNPWAPWEILLWNDVWYSTDGATWRQATSAAPWPPRYYHAVVGDNRGLWVLGGLSETWMGYQWVPMELNDVWYSSIPAAAGSSWKSYP